MFHIDFMDPWVLWLWVPILAVQMAVFAWCNLIRQEGVRTLWGDRLMLDAFSPRNRAQSLSLWGQWALLALVLAAALAGPNATRTPDMVPAGAVQVEFVYDVSPSAGAEEYRSFLPPPPGSLLAPGRDFQWGTRLDAAKYYTKNDLLPQIGKNQAGITTIEGAGYNMWDITTDLAANGAFQHMLDKFVQVGAAPGGGCDYTSGLQAALDEFSLMGKIAASRGDNSEKLRFIVLFTDGGFTGDQAALDKVLEAMKAQHVRLLLVAMGGNTPVTVPKYDATTHRRNGEYYKGTTRVDTKILTHMRDAVPGSELVLVPPGTAHVKYSFPEKAGGLHATPAQANLRIWFLLVAVFLFATITTGGGGLPRWKLIVPSFIADRVKHGLASLKLRLAGRNS